MASLNLSVFQKPLSRDTLCRLTFLYILGSLTYAFFSHALVHQLQAPILRFPYLDPVYWLAHLLKIPETVTQVPVLSWAIDLLLFGICILIIAKPKKRFFPALFGCLYLLYFILFNSYGTNHTLNKAGILLLPLAFTVEEKRFPAIWCALRYYLMFIFSSAFIWKLVRLAWLYPEQGELIMKKNLAPYLYFHPETTLAAVYRWLLTHPSLLQMLFLTGFILEGCFIIGFFTRKFDSILLIFLFLLVGGFWFTADALFVELLIFAFTLFRPRESVYGKM